MARPIEPIRRKLKALTIIIAAVLVLNIVLNDFISSNSLRRLQDDTKTNDAEDAEQRPKIYTFFEPNPNPKQEVSPKDEEMLELWIQSWSAAGWKPVVLRLQHAMAHPDFEHMKRTLKEECSPVSEYDVVRFFRFLAMVVVGGGWLSNYDVLPLNPPHDVNDLPHNGEFTLYQVPRVGPGAVRSLASGSAQEWNRLAHQIFYQAFDNRYSAQMWNDFYSIKGLMEDDVNFLHLEEGVVKGSTVLTGKAWDVENDCLKTEGKIAVQFSSDAFIRGKLRGYEHGDNDKAQIARHWLDMWERKCENTVPFGGKLAENIVQQ